MAQSQYDKSQKQQKDEIIAKITQGLIDQNHFRIQNDINQKNLTAIELQAKISEKQYQSQIEAAKYQVYQNRPIFNIRNTEYDSISNLAKFSILNGGKRPAKISQSTFISYNIKSKHFMVNIIPNNNSELDQSTIVTFSSRVSKSDYLDNDNMLYYLFFSFEDIVNSKSNHFVKYFRTKKNDKNAAGWSEALEGEKYIIDKQASLNNIILPN